MARSTMTKAQAESTLELTPDHGITSYTRKQLKSAYFAQAKKFHPDAPGMDQNSEYATANMALVNVAYDYLDGLFARDPEATITAHDPRSASTWMKDPYGWAHSTADNSARTSTNQRTRTYTYTTDSDGYWQYSTEQRRTQRTYRSPMQDIWDDIASGDAQTSWKRVEPDDVKRQVWQILPLRFKAYLYTLLASIVLVGASFILSVILGLMGIAASPLIFFFALFVLYACLTPFPSQLTYEVLKKRDSDTGRT